jgi:hypothetical protein
MLGLFFFLPSPAISPHQRNAYIQQKIASQSTVITAIDYTIFRQDRHSIRTEDCYECSALLVHWRLVTHGQVSILDMSDYDDYGKVNIAKTLQDAVEWNNKDTTATGNQWTPYFSDPLVIDGIPAGDVDEEISMPWFHITDQKLVHYNMHNNRVSFIAYVVVPAPEVIEVWRGAFVERELNSTSEQVAYDNMMLHKLDTDLLGSFRFVKDSSTTRMVVQHLSGDLASRTYPVRRALLVPLGPFIALPFILIAQFFEFLGPMFYYFLIWLGILVAFVGYRRMLEGGSTSSCCGRVCLPFHSLRRKQTKIRSRTGGVWGPAGPVDSNKQPNWVDEEKEIGLQWPGMARLGRV